MRACLKGGQVHLSFTNKKTGEFFSLPLSDVREGQEFLLRDTLFDIECKLIGLIKDTSQSANTRRIYLENIFNQVLQEAIKRGMYISKYNPKTRQYEV